PQGGADGPAGVALRPAPRKFSDKAVMDALSDEQLFASIKEGRPGTPMVAFRATLADDEIRALIAYIRTLAK
ncbi:MAG: cytochrome c, partial [Candidatus Methylomirabilis sp.]|nr:cytochrome c [Deltaproteobacteria bacterium]